MRFKIKTKNGLYVLLDNLIDIFVCIDYNLWTIITDDALLKTQYVIKNSIKYC